MERKAKRSAVKKPPKDEGLSQVAAMLAQQTALLQQLLTRPAVPAPAFNDSPNVEDDNDPPEPVQPPRSRFSPQVLEQARTELFDDFSTQETSAIPSLMDDGEGPTIVPGNPYDKKFKQEAVVDIPSRLVICEAKLDVIKELMREWSEQMIEVNAFMAQHRKR